MGDRKAPTPPPTDQVRPAPPPAPPAKRGPNDGGPAYPSRSIERAPGFMAPTFEVNHAGMTLRDYFAGQALAGFLAAPNGPHEDDVVGMIARAEPLKAARWSYEQADAMLAAREAARG